MSVIDQRTWVLAGPDRFSITRDGGRTWAWTKPNVPLTPHSIQFLSPDLGWAPSCGTGTDFLCDDGVPYQTEDGGRTWARRLTGT